MKTIDIATAVKALRAGELVAVPTETVYGLAADATNEGAVRQIFQVKGRPYDHPLIVHLADQQALDDWAREIPPYALSLARHFWPGPLTLVFKKQPQVLSVLTAGQDTIGIRVPDHPVALALLQAFGRGVAAPSANRFTHVSPTKLSAVEEELGEKIKWGLEGGECSVGVESTIVDVTTEVPVLLRPGMISIKDIAAVMGRHKMIERPAISHTRTPGMHHLHYAPTTKVALMAAPDLIDFLQSLDQAEFPVAVMSYTAFSIAKNRHMEAHPGAIYQVRMPKEAHAYAHDLYSTLRGLDNKGFHSILIETVPNLPEWEAVIDRLIKASGR